MQSQCTPSGAAAPAQARRLRSAAGFTLLELMAVLVLIGLLATVGIPNLIRAKIRAEMLAQVKTLRQSMAVARINAIKGGQPVALSMQNVGGVANLVAWVDADGQQDFDSGEHVLGQWTLPNKFSLTNDTTWPLYRLGSTSGPLGILFLPSGVAIVDDSREIGAGQGGVVLTDIKGNQFRLLVTGGAGTVEEEMWNPDIGDWDDSRNHWRY